MLVCFRMGWFSGHSRGRVFLDFDSSSLSRLAREAGPRIPSDGLTPIQRPCLAPPAGFPIFLPNPFHILLSRERMSIPGLGGRFLAFTPGRVRALSYVVQPSSPRRHF